MSVSHRDVAVQFVQRATRKENSGEAVRRGGDTSDGRGRVIDERNAKTLEVLHDAGPANRNPGLRRGNNS